MNMDVYKVFIQFKSGKYLEIKTESDVNPLAMFENDWKVYKKEGALAVGNYIIDIEEILYVKVEDDKLKNQKGETDA